MITIRSTFGACALLLSVTHLASADECLVGVWEVFEPGFTMNDMMQREYVRQSSGGLDMTKEVLHENFDITLTIAPTLRVNMSWSEESWSKLILASGVEGQLDFEFGFLSRMRLLDDGRNGFDLSYSGSFFGDSWGSMTISMAGASHTTPIATMPSPPTRTAFNPVCTADTLSFDLVLTETGEAFRFYAHRLAE